MLLLRWEITLHYLRIFFLQGIALQKVPKIKFIIIIGGAMFKSTKVAKDAYSSTMDIPSLHFLGNLMINNILCVVFAVLNVKKK